METVPKISRISQLGMKKASLAVYEVCLMCINEGKVCVSVWTET